MDSRSLRFLRLFLPVAAALAGLVAAFYWQDLGKERLSHEAAACRGVDLGTGTIANEYAAAASDLRYLSAQRTLLDFLAAPGPSTKGALARELLLFASRKGLYDRIRFIDQAGDEVVRVDNNDGRPAIVPDGRLERQADSYYFKDAQVLRRDELYASPLDLSLAGQEVEQPLKPVIRFAAPVFDARGRRRGIVALNYLGDRLLRKLDAIATGLPGDLRLLNGEGYLLRAPRRPEERAFMPGGGRTFGQEHPEAWREILRTRHGGAFLGDGMFHFDAFHPVTLRLNTGGRTDADLRVVYSLSNDGLTSGSHKLLRTLLVLCAVVLAVLAGLVLQLCRAQEARERDERRLRDSAARLKAMAVGLIATQERERMSLSRDLHDDIGQALTAACLELERSLAAHGKSDWREVVGRALETARQALERTRRLSGRLRPRVLDDLGLKEAARTLLEETRAKTGLEMEGELSFDNREVPPAVGENLYRILQEALTNAARHSKAARGRVTMRLSAGGIELTVRDHGVGFDRRAVEPGSLGLLSMRERAELMGGTFTLSSEPGRGTEVRVVVPVAGRGDGGRGRP